MAQKSVKTTSKQPQKVQPQQQRRSENRIAKWWRETMGELRKVNWPTTQEAWRLTRVVLVVMALMSLVLGLLDFVFSRLLALILA